MKALFYSNKTLFNCSAAIPPGDYNSEPVPNMVTFAAGSPTFRCVELIIIDDNIDEDQERFFVTAEPIGSQIIIPDRSSDVLIGDDDRE